jgi:tetratricopeptide (TPR) repeat protein
LAITATRGGGQPSTAAQNERQTAIVLEQQDKNADAETAWRAVLKARPANAEAYAHLGLLQARQEHYTEAIASYRKALALNPAFPSLRLNLGLALFKSGEMKEAVAVFTPLLKSQAPASPEAQRLTILLGMAHYGLGDYAAASPYLKQAAERDPQNLQLRLALAHSCLWSKQYQCVLDTYHEILSLNAESAEADMLAGEAQDELKNPSGAIDEFRAAVKADPQQPDVHFGLGYLLWTRRQYPEAVTEFHAELANNPSHAQALAYLGDAELQLSHPDAAIVYLQQAAKLAPRLPLPHLDLGIAYADQGKQENALTEMKEATRLDPEDANGHWHLGRLYRAMGKKDEATVEFDKASSIHKATNDALREKMSGAGNPGRTAAAQ